MTRAALNCLDDHPGGFFLMIEGGAVDWANHAGQAGRMIEEQSDFLGAVEAVVGWVEKHSHWDETLVIVTSDHETGLIWGPRSDRVAFEPIVDRGKGRVPGLRYNSTSHGNSLVPLYARGPESGQFVRLVRGTDAVAAAKHGFSGQYVDNTDIFTVVRLSLLGASRSDKLPACRAFARNRKLAACGYDGLLRNRKLAACGYGGTATAERN
jgi:alkaline phosphatase